MSLSETDYRGGTTGTVQNVCDYRYLPVDFCGNAFGVHKSVSSIILGPPRLDGVI